MPSEPLGDSPHKLQPEASLVISRQGEATSTHACRGHVRTLEPSNATDLMEERAHLVAKEKEEEDQKEDPSWCSLVVESISFKGLYKSPVEVRPRIDRATGLIFVCQRSDLDCLCPRHSGFIFIFWDQFYFGELLFLFFPDKEMNRNCLGPFLVE